MRTPLSQYIITSAIFIIGGGFIGWALAALTGGDTNAQSSGTGLGCAAGVVIAVVYYFATRNSGSLNDKAAK